MTTRRTESRRSWGSALTSVWVGSPQRRQNWMEPVAGSSMVSWQWGQVQDMGYLHNHYYASATRRIYLFFLDLLQIRLKLFFVGGGGGE